MKKLITLFTLVLILASSNSALALTPYQLAAAMLSTTNATCLDLTTNLSIKDQGTKPEEVRKLQTFLYPEYLTEPATGYFGVLTDAAVKKFQFEHFKDEEFVTGFVGPKTREAIRVLTCGNSQAAAGTKTGEPVARTPASTGSSYNSNGGWWLNPAATGVGTDSTVKTNNTVPANNSKNTTPTSTTTPPTDCDKYAGVIPGESRKLKVEVRPMYSSRFKPGTVYGNYSPEGLRDLELMRGDMAASILNPGGCNWCRISLRPGTVQSYSFKTTEYNSEPYVNIQSFANPATRVGVIGMSVSECPGDFTSPAVLEQAGAVSSDREGRFPDRRQRVCVVYGPSNSSGFGYGVFTTPQESRICELETNKNYYLNITTGFFNEEEGSKYPFITDEGHTEGAGPETEMVIDVDMHVWDAAPPANRNNETIKNRSAAYAEGAKIYEKYNEFIRAGEQRRQACIAALPASDWPSDAGGQSSAGWRRCSQQSKIPPLPYTYQ